MIGTDERSYIVDIPSGYDMTKPYRLFYASHWISSTADAVANEGFYYLKPKSVAANEPAIFIAPQGLPGNPTGNFNSGVKDHELFEGIMTFVKESLCIDEARVFAIGFSFGAMYTYSLSRNQQSTLRAAVGIAPANYNIYMPTQTGQPIAWMQTTGMSDGTSKWVNNDATMQGAKFIALEHAANNHCTIPANLPVWEAGDYLCYEFEGCDAGYPTRACTFNGGHVSDSGPSSSTSWISQEAWDFFMQF
jgi:poly(3-hydroxybutyrate) depolymerase